MDDWLHTTVSHGDKLLSTPDNKVHGTNMGPTWVLSASGGPHAGPINLVIRDALFGRNMSSIHHSFLFSFGRILWYFHENTLTDVWLSIRYNSTFRNIFGMLFVFSSIIEHRWNISIWSLSLYSPECLGLKFLTALLLTIFLESNSE